jgi:hypothetical protein
MPLRSPGVDADGGGGGGGGGSEAASRMLAVRCGLLGVSPDRCCRPRLAYSLLSPPFGQPVAAGGLVVLSVRVLRSSRSTDGEEGWVSCSPSSSLSNASRD